MNLIIDAHLDLAWNAVSWNRDLTEEIVQLREREKHMVDHPSRGRATVSLPEMRKAGIGVALATILVRAKPEVRPAAGFRRTDLDYATQSLAYAAGQGQMAYYRQLEAQGQLRIIHSLAALDSHLQTWNQTADRNGLPVGVVLAMEGADPIIEPSQVGAWYDQGVRVVGLAHYGAGCYATGTGARGPLTPRGRELLRHLDQLGMALDLTHCAEPGFFEALNLFPGTVLASHNNCRALVPGDRQFSDDQIRALIDRDAVIGVAFDAWMLHPGWQIGQSSRDLVSMAAAADHIDHICQLAGNCRHVGIGSDLDGGFGNEQSPRELETIQDLRRVACLLSERGYTMTAMEAVMHGNWLRILRRVFSRAEHS